MASSWLHRYTALGLVALLAWVPTAAASRLSSPAPQPNGSFLVRGTHSQGADPATNDSLSGYAKDGDASVSGQNADTVQQQAKPQTGTDQQAPAPPVGTAAAPSLTPEGAPASRPGGAAIAPAKQRRVRSLAIRVALVVGAAIAIGTVVAATAGSPSRPQ